MKLEAAIARRYLTTARRGGRLLSLVSTIAMGGVAIGVATLVAITGIFTGLQGDLRDKLLLTSPHIWILAHGEALRMTEWREPLALARGTPGVTAAAPFIHVEVGIRTRTGATEAVVVRGVDPAAGGVTEVARQIRDGRLAFPSAPGQPPPVLMGEALARRLGVRVGDGVVLVAFRAGGGSWSESASGQMRGFRVAGIFRTGLFEADNKFLYTTLAGAQGLTFGDGSVSGIEVRTADPDAAPAVADRIADRMGFGYRVEPWQLVNGPLFSALRIQKRAMGLILALIVVVAAFTIVSTLVMLVHEKTREIGILLAMGMTRGRILRIFVLQGVAIGAIGTALGLAVGIAGSWLVDHFRLIRIPGEIYFVEHIRVAYTAGDVAAIVGLAIGVATLATILPAVRASRLVPVEAISRE